VRSRNSRARSRSRIGDIASTCSAPTKGSAAWFTVYRLALFIGNVRLAGQLLRNTERLDVRQPAVIVTGSWLTVQEQMPEVYPRRLAERGYAAFTFDVSGFGESAGEPRQAEIPDRKIAEIVAAADFLSTLSLVQPDSIAHVAFCASAQYALAAVARGSRITRFISVARALVARAHAGSCSRLEKGR
jgi:dienelactone hydrolase